MSLVAFALRQAVLATLCPPVPSGDPIPTTHPTLVERRWYDSSPTAIDDFADAGGKPIGIVATTDFAVRDREQRSPAGQGGFASVVVVVHLSIAAVEQNGDEFVIGEPVTDAEMDASLDILCHQVLTLIRRSKLVKLCTPWGIGTIKITSDRDPESGLRLAGRRIEFEVEVYDDLDPAEWGRPPKVISDLASRLPAGSRQRALLDAVGEAAATPEPGYAAVVAEIRLAMDVAPTDTPSTDVEQRIAIDVDAIPPDPRAVLEPEDPDGEGPRDDTDPRDPHLAPRH